MTLSWFSWGPGNTAQLTSIQSRYADREPFGTITEIGNAFQSFQDAMNQYDWSDTPRQYGGVDPDIFINPPGTVYANGGGLSFGGGVNYANSSCSIVLPGAGAGGPFLMGVCFMMAFLEYWKFLPWFSWYVYGASLFLLIAYIVSKWIQKATN
jgi:hypothetical protein